MNKKILILILMVGIIIGAYRGYVRAEGSPCKITVVVYSLTNAYSNFDNTYKGDYVYDVVNGVTLNSDVVFACSQTGSGTCDGTNVSNAVSKWCTKVEDGIYKIDTNKTKAGTYSFNWRDSGVTASGNQAGNVTCGQSYSATNATYFFNFPDNQNVELVISSSGSISGDISWSKSGKGDWESNSWYKTRNKDAKQTTTSGLVISPDSNSGKLQIKNGSGGASDATITVYVSGTSLDLNLTDGTFGGTVPTLDGNSSSYEASSASNNGYADSYTVGNGYDGDGVSENTWTQIEILVNNFIDEIKMVSWFYYGIAFLTSILMIIVNIVKTAGAPNNPMAKYHFYIDLGVSFACLALLGASVILTRLFILTCLG